MTRTFFHVSEIEPDLQAILPAVVYKYRTWSDSYHQKLLTERSLWFSHPFDLNDPLDVRPETVFDLSEIQDDRYFQKLLISAADKFGNLSSDEQRKKAEEQWEISKKDPGHIVEAHKEIQGSRAKHDPYGVFSTSTNGSSERLWAEYADNYTGFNVGFRTMGLCQELKCSFGWVEYNDSPIPYSFINPSSDIDFLFRKKKSWSHEEEFRFITAGVGVYTDRTQQPRAGTVAELTLGHNMLPEHEKEIMETVNYLYPGLHVYKTKLDNGKLTRDRVQ